LYEAARSTGTRSAPGQAWPCRTETFVPELMVKFWRIWRNPPSLPSTHGGLISNVRLAMKAGQRHLKQRIFMNIDRRRGRGVPPGRSAGRGGRICPGRRDWVYFELAYAVIYAESTVVAASSYPRDLFCSDPHSTLTDKGFSKRPTMTCRLGIAPISRDRVSESSPRRDPRDSGWLRIVRLALVIYLSPVILLVFGLAAVLILLSRVARMFDLLRRALRSQTQSTRRSTRQALLSWTDHRPQRMEMTRRMRGLSRE
jgi:hypothetical protein